MSTFTVAAENFDPKYLGVNPNGTVPSLTATGLSSPLIDSRDIVQYIDNMRPSPPELQPRDADLGARAKQVIELIHADRMSTNLILLQARDAEEMRAKQSSPWKTFLENRQNQLQHWSKERPGDKFYQAKLSENTAIYQLYVSDDVEDADHQKFYSQSHLQYQDLAAGLDELNELIKLPYITGDSLTGADMHVVPWLSHAMWGAHAEGIQDFTSLEELIRKSVPSFKIGDRVKDWWVVMAKRGSFQDIYPELH